MRKDIPILAIQLFSTPRTSSELFEVISADAVIVRADYIENDDDIKSIVLARGFKIYSLKSVREGGRYSDTIEKRHSLLIDALNDYDVIELEAETDLTSDILRMIPSKRRLISWRGKASSFQSLESRFDQMKNVDARYYQLILDSNTISEGIWSLQLLKRNSDIPLISFASGAIGVWTQILSAYLGSKFIIGNLNAGQKKEIYLTHDQIKEDYDLPQIRKVRDVYGIAGNPVFSSMSPQIHNKCYEKLEMDALYLPFHIERFEEFWKFISVDFPSSELGIVLGGFTMVSPFKEESYKGAHKHLCPATFESKACNILINNNGEWCSDSSDGLGVLAVLDEEDIELSNQKVAIIGCGGAGRTIAARLKSEGANIVFYNRSEKRGQFASSLLSLPYKSISEFDASNYDIVINATPVGKKGKNLIFDPSRLGNDGLAIDMAYAKEDTMLVSGCRQHGKNIIEGKQILLHQVKKQFTGLTGREMPFEIEIMVRQKTANLLDLN